ncbi:MAG TPA: GNAT family N-acetyltransferase [Solirubrobacterales bacterium]|nr:GNAT family N-acetyltransferase [Solirubrobacterales bacterium]
MALSGQAVRKATLDDVPRLADALARAFDGDPPMRWFLSDSETRVARARRLFEVMLRRVHLTRDYCYTTSDVVGGALWVPPGTWRLGVVDQVVLLPGMVRVFGRGLARAQRGLTVMESGHPKTPHYYLDSLGVEPEWQGKGLGSALMLPVLERCDIERMPAYLNAGSARSRDLYLRHGFEVTEEFALPEDGPPLWRMWREPG